MNQIQSNKNYTTLHNFDSVLLLFKISYHEKIAWKVYYMSKVNEENSKRHQNDVTNTTDFGQIFPTSIKYIFLVFALPTLIKLLSAGFCWDIFSTVSNIYSETFCENTFLIDACQSPKHTSVLSQFAFLKT